MTPIGVVVRSCYGELLKRMCKMGLIKASKSPLNVVEDKNRTNHKELVVSLTSYGRRVKDVAPYAIISMMRQTYKPHRIVLWLDNDNWCNDNLPAEIKKLQKKGLDVRFCNDTRSYKKLIPALEAFPDDLIFTIDDDIYYPKDLLANVMEAYNCNPDVICCVRGYMLPADSNGQLAQYSTWKLIKKEKTGRKIFPTGGAGCLYQKRLLHKDITNVALFTKLAPFADDVWFFFMEFLAGTTIKILDIAKRDCISMDSFYQHFHKDSNLSGYNCGLSQYDIQIRNVMEHYGITASDLLKE